MDADQRFWHNQNKKNVARLAARIWHGTQMGTWTVHEMAVALSLNEQGVWLCLCELLADGKVSVLRCHSNRYKWGWGWIEVKERSKYTAPIERMD